jgi:hypothetical protein
MKQRISVEDLKQLTPSQQEKLREWWGEHRQKGDVFICLGNDFLSGKEFAWDGHNKPFNMSIPLVSIGQCIELLESEDCYFVTENEKGKNKYHVIKYSAREGRHDGVVVDGETIISTLFEAVKSIL